MHSRIYSWNNRYSDVSRVQYQLPLKPSCRIRMFSGARFQHAHNAHCVSAIHVQSGHERMKGARARSPNSRQGEFPGRCKDGNVNPRISLGAFWPAIYGNLTRPYCSSGRPRPSDILGVSSRIHRPILMIAVYQVSSFRAVRRTLLAILQPFAVFPPRFPDPSSPRQTSSFLRIPS